MLVKYIDGLARELLPYLRDLKLSEADKAALIQGRTPGLHEARPCETPYLLRGALHTHVAVGLLRALAAYPGGLARPALLTSLAADRWRLRKQVEDASAGGVGRRLGRVTHGMSERGCINAPVIALLPERPVAAEAAQGGQPGAAIERSAARNVPQVAPPALLLGAGRGEALLHLGNAQREVLTGSMLPSGIGGVEGLHIRIGSIVTAAAIGDYEKKDESPPLMPAPFIALLVPPQEWESAHGSDLQPLLGTLRAPRDPAACDVAVKGWAEARVESVGPEEQGMADGAAVLSRTGLARRILLAPGGGGPLLPLLLVDDEATLADVLAPGDDVALHALFVVFRDPPPPPAPGRCPASGAHARLGHASRVVLVRDARASTSGAHGGRSHARDTPHRAHAHATHRGPAVACAAGSHPPVDAPGGETRDISNNQSPASCPGDDVARWMRILDDATWRSGDPPGDATWRPGATGAPRPRPGGDAIAPRAHACGGMQDRARARGAMSNGACEHDRARAPGATADDARANARDATTDDDLRVAREDAADGRGVPEGANRRPEEANRRPPKEANRHGGTDVPWRDGDDGRGGAGATGNGRVAGDGHGAEEANRHPKGANRRPEEANGHRGTADPFARDDPFGLGPLMTEESLAANALEHGGPLGLAAGVLAGVTAGRGGRGTRGAELELTSGPHRLTVRIARAALEEDKYPSASRPLRTFRRGHVFALVGASMEAAATSARATSATATSAHATSARAVWSPDATADAALVDLSRLPAVLASGGALCSAVPLEGALHACLSGRHGGVVVLVEQATVTSTPRLTLVSVHELCGSPVRRASMGLGDLADLLDSEEDADVDATSGGRVDESAADVAAACVTALEGPAGAAATPMDDDAFATQPGGDPALSQGHHDPNSLWMCGACGVEVTGAEVVTHVFADVRLADASGEAEVLLEPDAVLGLTRSSEAALREMSAAERDALAAGLVGTRVRVGCHAHGGPGLRASVLVIVPPAE